MSPRALDRSCAAASQRTPERRLQSARDTALELAEAGPRPSATLHRSRPAPRRARLGWTAAGVFLALFLGSLLVPRKAAPPLASTKMRLTIPPPAGSSASGHARQFPPTAGCSPSSRRAPTATTSSISAPSIPSIRASSPGPKVQHSHLVPDGRSIGFFAQSKLKRIEVAGGTPVTLCDAQQSRGGSWGSRGVVIASVNAGGALVRVAERGGPATPLLQLQPGGSYRWPCFLPDGIHFVYWVFPGAPGRSHPRRLARVQGVDSSRCRGRRCDLRIARRAAVPARRPPRRAALRRGPASPRRRPLSRRREHPVGWFVDRRDGQRPPRTRAFSSVRQAARSPAAFSGTTGRAAS